MLYSADLLGKSARSIPASPTLESPKNTRYAASLSTLLTEAANTPSSTVGSIVNVAVPDSVTSCSNTSVGSDFPNRATTVTAVLRSISTSPGSTISSVSPIVSASSDPLSSSRLWAELVSRPQRPAATTPVTRKQNATKLNTDQPNICRPGTTDFQFEA